MPYKTDNPRPHKEKMGQCFLDQDDDFFIHTGTWEGFRSYVRMGTERMIEHITNKPFCPKDPEEYARMCDLIRIAHGDEPLTSRNHSDTHRTTDWLQPD